MKISFTLNGDDVTVDTEPTRTLVEILREDLNLTGTKFGCGQGECGACTVIMDGDAVNSCLILAPQLEGHAVTTIEGLSKNGTLDPLQEAFADEGAVQCGYCTPGMIMSASALLNKNADPSQSEIKTAISGNLCRCTGYTKIIQAITTAAERIKN